MDEIRRAYDRWASSYDTDRNATRDLDGRVVREAPLEIAGREVVELGCGTGKNTAWLAESARSVVALDFSPEMLSRARERVSPDRVRFVQHDVREPWPLPDASADAVIGNLVLEHVEDLAHVFREARRVLRAGGQLFVCELHPYRQLRGGQAHFTDIRSGDVVHIVAHVHAVSEYVNGAVAAGFSVVEIGEWIEDGAPAQEPPRLFSMLATAAAPGGRAPRAGVT